MKNPYPLEDRKVLFCPWCQYALFRDGEPWKFKYKCISCNKHMKVELLEG